MIKKLARSIREYKRDCILTPVFVVVEVIMEVLIPFLMAKLIDEGISSGDMAVMRSTGTALIVCVLIGLLSGVLAGAFCATASAGFAKNLRQDLFDKIQTYSFANIDKFSTSGIVTRLTTDVTNVQNAFMMIIRIAVRAPFTLLFSLVTLPVEINASKRALGMLEGVLDAEELQGAKAVLSAAALTYLASVISSALQLLRLILISRSRNRD